MIIAVQQLTKGLEKTLLIRAQYPVPRHPLESYAPLPTIRIPKQNGYYESQPCTTPCKFHPGNYDKDKKVGRCLTFE